MTATRPRRRGKRAFSPFGSSPDRRLATTPQTPVGAWCSSRLLNAPPCTKNSRVGPRHPCRGPSGSIRPPRVRHDPRSHALGSGTRREKGEAWLAAADVEIRRGKGRVIDRILITGENPCFPHWSSAPPSTSASNRCSARGSMSSCPSATPLRFTRAWPATSRRGKPAPCSGAT